MAKFRITAGAVGRWLQGEVVHENYLAESYPDGDERTAHLDRLVSLGAIEKVPDDAEDARGPLTGAQTGPDPTFVQLRSETAPTLPVLGDGGMPVTVPLTTLDDHQPAEGEAAYPAAEAPDGAAHDAAPMAHDPAASGFPAEAGEEHEDVDRAAEGTL